MKLLQRARLPSKSRTAELDTGHNSMKRRPSARHTLNVISLRAPVRSLLFLVLMATAGVVLAACTPGPPPGTGDPGNVRLHELQADPVVKELPPDSHLISRTSSPASWDTTYGGWSGPAVTVEFTSSLTIQQVFDFYATLAAKAGWQANGFSDFGLPDEWTKTYQSDNQADMELYWGGERLPLRSSVDSQPYNLGIGDSAIVTTPG